MHGNVMGSGEEDGLTEAVHSIIQAVYWVAVVGYALGAVSVWEVVGGGAEEGSQSIGRLLGKMATLIGGANVDAIVKELERVTLAVAVANGHNGGLVAGVVKGDRNDGVAATKLERIESLVLFDLDGVDVGLVAAAAGRLFVVVAAVATTVLATRTSTRLLVSTMSMMTMMTMAATDVLAGGTADHKGGLAIGVLNTKRTSIVLTSIDGLGWFGVALRDNRWWWVWAATAIRILSTINDLLGHLVDLSLSNHNSTSNTSNNSNDLSNNHSNTNRN